MKNLKAIIIVNSITMTRVIGTFIMPFVYKVLSPAGLVVYITLLLLTDALDGVLARKLHACTIFGSLLDQGADKLLGIATLAILARSYPIMFLPIITELMIIFINSRGGVKGAIVESSILGKIKTWVLGIAIVGGFCTVYAEEIIRLLNGSPIASKYLIDFFYDITLNKAVVMNSIAFATLGAGVMVASDYHLRVRHDIKKAREMGLTLENIRIKWDKDLIKVLFDEEYYYQTKKEPLIKKIGKVSER